MTIVVETALLNRALASVSAIIARTSTIDIATHIMLEARHDTLRIVGNDFTVSLAEMIPCESDRNEAYTVPGAAFKQIVSALRSGSQVTLDHDGEKSVTITSGRFTSKLPTLDAGKYPVEFSFPDAKPMKLNPALLATVLDDLKCAGNSASDIARYQGPHFYPSRDGGTLTIVTTNGWTMGYAAIGIKDGVSETSHAVVPWGTTGLITKLCKEIDEDEVEISISARGIQMEVGSCRLASKVVDIEDLRQMVDFFRAAPRESVMSFSSEDATGALEKCMSVIGAAGKAAVHGHQIRLRPGDGECEFYTPPLGEGMRANEFVSMEAEKDPRLVYLNGSMLLAMIKSLSADTVQIKTSSSVNSVLIKPLKGREYDIEFYLGTMGQQ